MKNILCLLLLNTTIVFSQDWKTDFDQAKNLAQEENQKIILVFSGSDWCAPCMKLEREIWSAKTFQDHAKSNYVMLKADFPRRKKNVLSIEQQNHNNTLAEKYNKNGYFPFVVILDKDGIVLGETGYKKTTPEAFIKLIDAY